MKEIQDNGQLRLWPENYNNELLDPTDIEDKAIKHIKKYTNLCSLNIILADFFMEYEPICNCSTIRSIYKNLEKTGQIEVLRDPACTKEGKPSAFFIENKNQKIKIRWIT